MVRTGTFGQALVCSNSTGGVFGTCIPPMRARQALDGYSRARFGHTRSVYRSPFFRGSTFTMGARDCMKVMIVGLIGAVSSTVTYPAAASVDGSRPPSGVYSLKPGIYVQKGVDCGSPPNAAIRQYDGNTSAR